jgi:CheY-like chemotaxis protein
MNILLVEDSEAEHVIMQEAFREAGVLCQLSIVKDGFEALEFLGRQGTFQSAPKPNLIILDLNLPKKNGREVLVEIKNNPRWEHIPILVFSNSESPRDICQCYSLRVNAYMNKPAGFQEFVDLAHVINTFWLKLVRYCSHY